MDPAQNEGRAGPGNAGGFGWPATGIELRTEESGVKNGPAIVAAMLRRQSEAARDHVAPGDVPTAIVRPDRAGMPLGLPRLRMPTSGWWSDGWRRGAAVRARTYRTWAQSRSGRVASYLAWSASGSSTNGQRNEGRGALLVQRSIFGGAVAIY